MAAGQEENRRLFERTSVGYVVQLQLINPVTGQVEAALAPGISRDLSRQGMGVWINEPVPVQSQLLVTMEEERGGLDHAVSRSGSVARVEATGALDRNLVGIEFRDDG